MAELHVAAADEDREVAALEWSEALIGNTILEQLKQPGERDASRRDLQAGTRAFLKGSHGNPMGLWPMSHRRGTLTP